MSKLKVIAIVGPTASGKSSLGIYLAKKLNGEVISADSRQVYKGLNIGTGKVTKKEMTGVPHHLLSVVSPKKQFTADDFVKQAERVISGLIYQSTKHRTTPMPIVVGGTGFYVDALLGRMVLPNVPPNHKLRAKLEKKSVEDLYMMLMQADPQRAKTIEPKHKRRLIRALEIAEHMLRQTTHARALRAARPSLTLASSSLAPQQYDVLWLGINPAPEKLKNNIHKRLHTRMKQGMIQEAKKLHKAGLSYKRMEELGLEYRFLAQYLRKQSRRKVGTPTVKFDASGLEREINKYAKRQWRWFKRNKDIHWITGNKEALRLSRKFLGGTL